MSPTHHQVSNSSELFFLKPQTNSIQTLLKPMLYYKFKSYITYMLIPELCFLLKLTKICFVYILLSEKHINEFIIRHIVHEYAKNDCVMETFLQNKALHLLPCPFLLCHVRLTYQHIAFIILFSLLFKN